MITERMKAREKPTLVGIQYLRGIAALAVVFYHVFSNRVAQDWGQYSNYGIVGVDVFFVISGFIMWRTTSQAARPSAFRFLLRRVARIYPAWWIALTIWIIIRLVVPDRLHNADVNAGSLIASYMLAPHYHPVFQNHVWPILVPGWTLELEILFYLLFAGTLWIASGRIKLITIVAILTALSIIGFQQREVNAFLDDLTHPLMLEFAAGIVIASQFNRLKVLPNTASITLLVVGLCLIGIFTSPMIDGAPIRALTLGPAAMLIVAGGIGLEKSLRVAPVRSLLILGDASYSLYLTHPISISSAAVVWERLHLPTGASPMAIFFIPVAMAVAIAVAIFFYRFVELPLLERLMPILRQTTIDMARVDAAKPIGRSAS